MDHNRFHVFRIALVAALGGFLFGFDTAVISGTTEKLQEIFSLSDQLLGFTVAAALIGTILGAALVSKPCDRFGRRNVLVVMAVLYFISAFGSAYAWDWWSFMAFRLIGGLGVGGASVVSPMYIAEVSPARTRGKMVALQQFNIVFGILMAFVSNYAITRMGLGEIEWRWMFGVEAAPALLFFILLFTIPFSPRWLVSRGRGKEAREVLGRLEAEPSEADAALQAIETSFEQERNQAKQSIFQKKYTKVILLAVAITAFNQLSGINAILYYAPRVFKMTGAGSEDAMMQSIIVGIVNLVFTMLALGMIDRMGRKKLMLVGSVGYIVSLGICAAAFFTFATPFKIAGAALQVSGLSDRVERTDIPKVSQEAARTDLAKAKIELAEITRSEDFDGEPFVIPDGASKVEIQKLADTAFQVSSKQSKSGGLLVLCGIFAFIASHAFGQGAVVWVFVSEIFPNRVRAGGQSVGSFSIWVFAAIVSQAFPVVIGALGGGATFSLFCGFMVIQLLWVIFIMPETKGVPLEDIEKKLGIR